MSSIKLMGVGLAGAGALAACDWRVYDDLQDELWVDSQTRPTGVDSSEFADQVLGLTPADGDEGMVLALLGRNQESVIELTYDAAGEPGKAVLPQGGNLNELTDLGLQFNFNQYQPFAREEGTGRVAVSLVTYELGEGNEVKGDFKIIILERDTDASGNVLLALDAAYQPFSLDVPLSGQQPTQSVAFAGGTHLVAARSNQIILADDRPKNPDDPDAPLANHELTGCNLPDGEGVFAVAFGDVGTFIDPDTTAEYEDVVAGGDIVALLAPMDDEFQPTGPGRIVVVTGGFLEDTSDPAAACQFADGVELAGVPAGVGSELIITDLGAGDGPRVVATFPGVSGELRIVNLGVRQPSASRPVEVPGLGSVEVADLDGEAPHEIIFGVPTGDSEDASVPQMPVGSTSTTPRSAPILMTLREAEPEAEKRFGTSVTTAPFVVDGEAQNVLVVSASGEVFTYFRTALYDDVRVGR
jgi:hypothetical protein